MEGQVTDTSGIVANDGHFLHDHPGIMGDPSAKNALAKYETADKAMLGGIEAMKQLGKPHINIPADDADDAAKAEYQSKIAKAHGAVEKVEDFKITRPDGTKPEGDADCNYNYALEKSFLEMAVSEGMNQSQLEKCYGMALQMIAANSAREDTDQVAAADKCRTQLTSDLGGEEKYKVFHELNTRCLETFFGVETARAIETAGLGNNVEFNKGINKLAEMAVKEGRTMQASAQTGEKKGGMLSYPSMNKKD